jgi:cytochrome c oxidase subunit 3
MKKIQITHLVNPSPWPVIGSISIILMTTSTIMIIYKKNLILSIISLIISLITFFSWRNDIFKESRNGDHNIKVQSTLKIGIILFIVSEVFLFISIFWAFFHSSISPRVELGINFPPKQIKSFNYREIPILNTIILLSSGATITNVHIEIFLINKFKIIKFPKIKNYYIVKNINSPAPETAIPYFLITIILGIIFTIIQLIEYLESKFSINDSVFGTTFFITTGLHGIHVIVGTIFLSVVIIKIIKNKNIPNQIISFEISAWYWHFVDVVWLFLLVSIYWWGLYSLSSNYIWFSSKRIIFRKE